MREKARFYVDEEIEFQLSTICRQLKNYGLFGNSSVFLAGRRLYLRLERFWIAVYLLFSKCSAWGITPRRATKNKKTGGVVSVGFFVELSLTRRDFWMQFARFFHGVPTWAVEAYRPKVAVKKCSKGRQKDGSFSRPPKLQAV